MFVIQLDVATADTIVDSSRRHRAKALAKALAEEALRGEGKWWRR